MCLWNLVSLSLSSRVARTYILHPRGTGPTPERVAGVEFGHATPPSPNERCRNQNPVVDINQPLETCLL